MGILSWIVLGLIAGALAKWLMPGRDGGGWIITMVLGIAGAFVGGYLGSRKPRPSMMAAAPLPLQGGVRRINSLESG